MSHQNFPKTFHERFRTIHRTVRMNSTAVLRAAYCIYVQYPTLWGRCVVGGVYGRTRRYYIYLGARSLPSLVRIFSLPPAPPHNLSPHLLIRNITTKIPNEMRSAVRLLEYPNTPTSSEGGGGFVLSVRVYCFSNTFGGLKGAGVLAEASRRERDNAFDDLMISTKVCSCVGRRRCRRRRLPGPEVVKWFGLIRTIQP